MSTQVYLNPKKSKLGEALGPNWHRFSGLGGLSAAAAETVVNYIVNPFGEDVYILDALMHIRTVDAQDADLDIGIADDAAGTNADDSLFDSPANSALGILAGLAVHAIAGRALPKWAKAGAAADSYITTQQNGNVDASSLVYDLYLLIVRAKDLVT